MPLPKSAVNVEEALALHHQGWTFRMIAQKYGVSTQRVHQKIGHLICDRVPLCTRCQKRLADVDSILCDECKLAAKNKCPDCGDVISHSSKRCVTCNGVSKRAFNVPLAARLYEAGYTLDEVAGFFGVSNVRVYLQVKKLGVTFRSRGRGHKSPTAPIERIAELLTQLLPRQCTPGAETP